MRKRLYSVPSKLVSCQMPLSILDEVELIRVGNFTTTSDVLRKACAEGIKVLKRRPLPFDRENEVGAE